MPLQDHFIPPLSRTHPWRGFHSAWAAAIARHLNQGILPEGYYAVPNVELDGPVEIDVATLQEGFAANGIADSGGLMPWTPPEPALTATLDFPPLDLLEVQVLYDTDGPRLMAAVELVSPSNKDRASKRRAFTTKCVSYLDQGSSVVVVDTVTTRRTNFHAEILRLLEMDQEAVWESPTKLYAAAYRVAGPTGEKQLQVWTEPLALGRALPRLPLWLGTDFCVPLDLEVTYQATCSDLRIRSAG